MSFFSSLEAPSEATREIFCLKISKFLIFYIPYNALVTACMGSDPLTGTFLTVSQFYLTLALNTRTYTVYCT